MDTLDWSKQYIVFSVSRLDLEHQLGFSHDTVAQLSDEDMQRITERVRENYGDLEEDFLEAVRFITATVVVESHTDNRMTETERQAEHGSNQPMQQES